ncbi:MAG: hypothetical protein K0S53_2960 [Bacteroidetes bacterium]|jgi:hypothetical protein|nr:hypothetical protein [Bacteroidota bacterium]MDF2453542.1 hypothetical protein [Bacteroidota bacterium]
MKKIILLAAVITVASFASCKKDRTCECTYTTSGTTNTVSHTSSTTLTKVKKSDAKYFCTKDVNTNTSTSGSMSNTSTSTSDCKLK